MFHCFFSSPARSRYLSLLKFYHEVCRDGKVDYPVVSVFCWLSLGLIVWPRLCDLFVSQNPREVCTSHFPRRILGYSLRVFLISVRWGSFTGVWVTANLLKSPGLFSVFWSILIMLLFGWHPLIIIIIIIIKVFDMWLVKMYKDLKSTRCSYFCRCKI